MFGVYDPSLASGSEELTQEDPPFDTNAAHAVWLHSSVSLGNLVSTAKSFHIPLSRDMISKKRLLQREHGTHSSKYSLMGKSKVRLTSTKTASVCSDAPERFWASTPDHLTGPNREAEAAYLSINLNQMMRPYLHKEEPESTLISYQCKRLWVCKYTHHRPVDRANENHPQLNVSMAASLMQCLLDLHHEQCVKNVRRISPSGGTLDWKRMDKCPTWCRSTDNLYASEADPLPDSLCVYWEWEFLTTEQPIFLEDRRLETST